MSKCPDCDGPAILADQGDGRCSACHGTGDGGWLDAAASAIDISGPRDSFCSDCGGSGDCQTCGGSGEID